MQKHLLNHLPYFSVAAKHLSFSNAANELAVSQSSISYQIKSLEEKLGFSLFIRGQGSKAELTNKGRKLYQEYNFFERNLNQVIEDTQLNEKRTTLAITAPIDFGVKLLTPALSQLEMNKLIINLDLSDQVINFKRSNFDFSIRNNTKEEGLEYLSLLNATNLLVCSQDYAHKNQLNVFSDITKKHRLITRNAHKSNTWENIFIKHGKLFQTHKNIQVINNSFGIQEAMIAGTGIAILPDYFIEHHYKDKIFIFNELINKTEFFLAYQPSYIAKKWANKIRTSIINAFNDR